jgi:hypothetical protein
MPTMIANPWFRLPEERPFILPEDKDVVEKFNEGKGEDHAHFVDLRFIPEPFIGHKNARLVFLGNNPGINSKNPARAAHRLIPAFQAQMRKNLLHQLPGDSLFIYLDPGFNPVPNKYWELVKLRHILREFRNIALAKSLLGRNMLAIERCPYVSKRFGNLRVPSQKYSHQLVRNAMDQNAVIIVYRGQKKWKEAVEKLSGYPRSVFVEPNQSGWISSKTCGGGWPLIQEAISEIKRHVRELPQGEPATSGHKMAS